MERTAASLRKKTTAKAAVKTAVKTTTTTGKKRKKRAPVAAAIASTKKKGSRNMPGKAANKTMVSKRASMITHGEAKEAEEEEEAAHNDQLSSSHCSDEENEEGIGYASREGGDGGNICYGGRKEETRYNEDEFSDVEDPFEDTLDPFEGVDVGTAVEAGGRQRRKQIKGTATVPRLSLKRQSSLTLKRRDMRAGRGEAGEDVGLVGSDAAEVVDERGGGEIGAGGAFDEDAVPLAAPATTNAALCIAGRPALPSAASTVDVIKMAIAGHQPSPQHGPSRAAASLADADPDDDPLASSSFHAAPAADPHSLLRHADTFFTEMKQKERIITDKAKLRLKEMRRANRRGGDSDGFQYVIPKNFKKLAMQMRKANGLAPVTDTDLKLESHYGADGVEDCTTADKPFRKKKRKTFDDVAFYQSQTREKWTKNAEKFLARGKAGRGMFGGSPTGGVITSAAKTSRYVGGNHRMPQRKASRAL